MILGLKVEFLVGRSTVRILALRTRRREARNRRRVQAFVGWIWQNCNHEGTKLVCFI